MEMKASFAIFMCLVCCLAGADDPFVYKSCYETKFEDRMPLSIDNLISLVEKYEAKSTNQDPADVAENLLGRYRQNGIVYCPTSELNSWNVNQLEEAYKQELDDQLLTPSGDVPDELYDSRAECSIHMMLSHSTDIYPHAGVDQMWDYSPATSPRTRNKRSTLSMDCLDGNEPTLHPIENGIIQTAAGPVAAGILMAGIMSKDSSKTYLVEELIGSASYMPDEMLKKRVHSFYGSTMSGEIGQAAIVNSKLSGNNEYEIGPTGMFGNCTACARLFTLKEQEFSYFSRAELFASLDVHIIREAFRRFSGSSGNEIKLSEILRMYYSDHGLFNSAVKACNRQAFVNIMDDSELQEYALNYMYAYQNNFPQFKTFIKDNKEDFEKIEREFTNARDEVIREIKSFMQASYNKDNQGYFDCKDHRNNEILETEVDLVVIYTPQESQEENEIEAEYITHVARSLGVGYRRSQLVVVDPGYSRWESPIADVYQNRNNNEDKTDPYFNVADWSCNFTTNLRLGGSSTQDFEDVIDELEKIYSKYYKKIRSDEDYRGIRSQVILWNLPQAFRGDREEMRERLRLFRELYPDISYILAGSSTAPINEFLGENRRSVSFTDIFVSTSGKSSEEIAAEIVPLAQKSPRMFVYPACDTSNTTLEDYDEGSHVYTTYITPNRTTLIRIPPQNFHYSETLKLTFKEKDFHVCISRTNKMPSEDDSTEITYCETGNFELEQFELCGRYVNECSPIYISATALNKNSFCSDENCIYPNQLEFEMTHEGMTCGAWLSSPFSFFLILTLILVILVLE